MKINRRLALVLALPAVVLGLAAGACSSAKQGNDSPTAKAGDKAGDKTPADVVGGAKKKKPARTDVHPVFSLVDNRLLAHTHRGGSLVVTPGTASFAKYLRFARAKGSWKLHQTQDGKTVATADKYAQFDVPLTSAQASAGGGVTLRVYAPTKRNFGVKVEGKDTGTVSLAEGWQTINVPTGPFIAGENNVQLVWSKGPALSIEWMQIGGQAPGSPAGDDAPVAYDAKAKALVLPRDSGLSYYIQVPKDGHLIGDVQGDGCQVKVTVAAAEGKPVEGTLSADSGDVDLSALAGKIARLDLTTAGCAEAKLADAALTMPGPAPVVKKAKPPKYIVFWLMDSLRADRVKPFNPKARPDVPTFEKLAQNGAAFVQAYSQGNESLASHSSLWSANYVVNHRMIPKGNTVIPSKYTTLPEAMKAAGFYTSGVSSNGFITKAHGFGGPDVWDAYRNHIHDGGGVKAEDLVGKALASVEKHKDKPFFLYIGTIDTHVSWRAKEPWISKYDPEAYSGKYKKELTGKEAEKMAKPNERDLKRIVAIYDSNVSYQDDQLARFMAKLEEWGIADETMIVITADHGDEQWEEGRVGHGGSARETLVHVPLVVYYPPLIPGGVVDEGADGVDVLPTLLDAMGLQPPEDAQGESLIPLTQGIGRGYPRPTVTSQYEFAWAMRMAGWKVRVAGSGVPDLYHVADDLLEKDNLAQKRPIERRFLTDAFSTFLVYGKEWRKVRWGVSSNMSPTAADEIEKL